MKAAAGKWVGRGGDVMPYEEMNTTQLRAAIRTAISRALKCDNRTEAMQHLLWSDDMKQAIADGRYAGAPEEPDEIIKKPVYGEKTETKCQCGCEKHFMVRVADLKRGWAKYYSKSCAQRARHAEQREEIIKKLEALPLHNPSINNAAL